MPKLNKYEKVLWNLLVDIGARKEYCINGYFLTFEEAKMELEKVFNLKGLELLSITISTIHGNIFKKVEPAGETRIIPRNNMLQYLK